MIVLLEGLCRGDGGTMEIADGDFITPQLLMENGRHFPRGVVMRFTFPEGPYYSSSNGSALITVEWNDEWPEEILERMRRIETSRNDGMCKKRFWGGHRAI